MGLTNDRSDPGLKKIRPDGQQEVYWVMSDEERAKGFVRPVRNKYVHQLCGSVTVMGQAIAETYAASPKAYSGTFCCHCGKHFALKNRDGSPAFLWCKGGDPVGSTEAEAIAYLSKQKFIEAKKHEGEGI